MSGSIRVSAKTVDDAITEASIQLGITSDQLEYDVIEKGSAGFLGIGAKQAVIEAQKKRKTIEAEVTDVTHDENKPDEKIDTSKTIKNKPSTVAPEKVVEKPSNVSTFDRKSEEAKEEKVAPVAKERKSFTNEKPLGLVEENTISAVSKFLVDTISAMGLEVQVTTGIDPDGALSVDLVGEQMGILIGKRGQTLDALQYLANRVANKQQEDYVRVKLDTENYRARREETLERLARSLASKVKRTRRPVSLEPMNPYERRVIHSILQSDRFVVTHSEGEEPYRKVVITLKNNRRNY